jgi:glycosyltransferase involved in cell wall biosynthesis
MLKIAVIFESSPFDRKGLFNAVHNRVRHLAATGECTVDVFCIHSRDTELTRRLRKTPKVDEVDDVVIEGIRYRLLWYDFSISDHMFVNYFHMKPLFFSRFLRKTVGILEGYDHISAHSFAGGLVARMASSEFGIPYTVTWHGSDVHTHPWRNPLIMRDTQAVMRDSACNFFVSRALMKESEKILDGVRKEVLYNGVSEAFVRLADDEREALRAGYGLLPGDKVVAFVGNLVQVKNVKTLQPVFHGIRQAYEGSLKFWIVGDGKLRKEVEDAMADDKSLDVLFWGNVPAEKMPSVMNCMDLLVLPSINEGLPLVCAEALSCGVQVIGSDRGGIPEVVGKDSVIPLADDFVEELASLAVKRLVSPAVQCLPEELSWAETAARELAVLKSVEGSGK